jgi:hypothetical protein
MRGSRPVRLILLAFMLCAPIVAAEPIRTEPGASDHLGSKPNGPKGKRAFHPFRLLRRLGRAESEFGLRLSSFGIQQEVEHGRLQSHSQPGPSTEASGTMPQQLGGGSQYFAWMDEFPAEEEAW